MDAAVSAPKECRCKQARHKHGTLGAYQIDGCRCFPCRLNRAKAHEVYRQGGQCLEHEWADAAGATRRLQALSAIGWTDAQVAAACPVTIGHLNRIRRGEVARLMQATDRHIRDVFTLLWDKPQTGGYADRARRAAARKGWVSPLAWDDIDDPDEEPKLSAPRGAREIAECGTPAAVRRHYRNHEPLDQACAAAQRLHAAERKAKRRAA